MDREKAKALLPIIAAYANGETIQINYHDGWKDTEEAGANAFAYPAEKYRIKPKPRTFYGIEYADGSVGIVLDGEGKRDVAMKDRERYEYAKNSRPINLVEVLD